MTIKKQFILLSSIIVIIPILTIVFIIIQHYLSSPRSVMMEAYQDFIEENQNEYSENDLKILRQTLEKISPDFEFTLFSREKVLISTIPEIKKDDTINSSILINLINSSSNKYIYQYRLINSSTVNDEVGKTIASGQLPDSFNSDDEITDFFLFSRILRGQKRYRFRTITFTYLIIFILVIIFFCIILIVVISKNIFRSIETLDSQTQAIADGNLDLKIDVSGNEKSTTPYVNGASVKCSKCNFFRTFSFNFSRMRIIFSL